MKTMTTLIAAGALTIAAIPVTTASAARLDRWDPPWNPPPTLTPHCNGRPATIIGTSSGDRLYGTSGDDVIYAGAGNDVVYGFGGNDTICGGDGDDFIVGGQGNDMLIGERGRDHIDAMDTPTWSWGWDTAIGGEGADTILTRDQNVDLVFGRHMGNWPHTGGSEPDNIDVCVMDGGTYDLNFCRWSS